MDLSGIMPLHMGDKSDFERVVQLYEKSPANGNDWKAVPIVVIGMQIPQRMKRICPYFILCDRNMCAFRNPHNTRAKIMYCKKIPKEFEYRGEIPENMGVMEDMTLFELVDVEE